MGWIGNWKPHQRFYWRIRKALVKKSSNVLIDAEKILIGCVRSRPLRIRRGRLLWTPWEGISEKKLQCEDSKKLWNRKPHIGQKIFFCFLSKNNSGILIQWQRNWRKSQNTFNKSVQYHFNLQILLPKTLKSWKRRLENAGWIPDVSQIFGWNLATNFEYCKICVM